MSEIIYSELLLNEFGQDPETISRNLQGRVVTLIQEERFNETIMGTQSWETGMALDMFSGTFWMLKAEILEVASEDGVLWMRVGLLEGAEDTVQLTRRTLIGLQSN